VCRRHDGVTTLLIRGADVHVEHDRIPKPGFLGGDHLRTEVADTCDRAADADRASYCGR
jgi:hypothetical protein